ncbi:MAG TPA: hypothetical protein PK951_13315, partial [Chitinophagaceae bacterium]|nr:hypothetical protein [Chitinophagaceae bacterium]
MNICKFLVTATLIFMVTVVSCRKADSPVKVERKPPNAVAGPDQVITLPQDTILLDGRASNDPDGEITGFRWTKVYGPPNLTLTSTNWWTIIARDLQEGIY